MSVSSKNKERTMVVQNAGFGDIWLGLQTLVTWITSIVVQLVLLTPISMLQRGEQQHGPDNREDELAAAIKPCFRERIANLFQSEEKRKLKLLHWTQNNLKRHQVTDFTSCWQDGIVLCALLDTIRPGLCPQYKLLKSHHRVNNCRLGLKQTQRFLALKQLSITPEEMAIADDDTQQKIIQLVQMIKWRSSNCNSCKTIITDPVVLPKQVGVVQARGTGIKFGIVGRKARFNIITIPDTFVDLSVDIRGPNAEMSSEIITSFPPTQSLDSPDTSKLIFDKHGNSFIRQKSLEQDVRDIIPFDCQSVGNGRFLVTYIPRSPGIHVVIIKSESNQIEGSPFEVKINDFVGSWNIDLKPRSTSLPAIDESVKEDKHQTTLAQISKQLTIKKRRRVLKRVINTNGLPDCTPSPSLSRQSSIDISDLSGEEHTKSNSPLTVRFVEPVQKASAKTVNILSNRNDVFISNDSSDRSSQSPNRVIMEPPCLITVEAPFGRHTRNSTSLVITDDDDDVAVPLSSKEEAVDCKHTYDKETGPEDKPNNQNINNNDEPFTLELPTPKQNDCDIPEEQMECKDTSISRQLYCNMPFTKIRTLKSESLQNAFFFLSDRSFSCTSDSTDSHSSVHQRNKHPIFDTSEPSFEETKTKERCKSLDSTFDNISQTSRQRNLRFLLQSPIVTIKNEDEDNELLQPPSNASFKRNYRLSRQNSFCHVDKSSLSFPDVMSDTKNVLPALQKMDAITQVSYGEIIAETGWVSKTYCIKRRQSSAPSNKIDKSIQESKFCKQRKLEVLLRWLSKSNLIPDIIQDVAQQRDISPEDSSGIAEGPRFPDAFNSRQSTIDSGIGESHKIGLTGMINGHQRISRQYYPWDINLDPDLTNRSSCSSLQDGVSQRLESPSTVETTSPKSMRHIFSRTSTTSPAIYISDAFDGDTTHSDSDVGQLDTSLRRKHLKRARVRRQLLCDLSSSSIDTSYTNELYTANSDHTRVSVSSAEDINPDFMISNTLSSNDLLVAESSRISPRLSWGSDDSSYCGFGLTKTKRKDLLGNLEMFQNINVDSSYTLPIPTTEDRSQSSDDETNYINQCFGDQHNLSGDGHLDDNSLGGDIRSGEEFIDAFLENNPDDNLLGGDIRSGEEFIDAFLENNPDLVPPYSVSSDKQYDPPLLHSSHCSDIPDGVMMPFDTRSSDTVPPYSVSSDKPYDPPLLHSSYCSDIPDGVMMPFDTRSSDTLPSFRYPDDLENHYELSVFGSPFDTPTSKDESVSELCSPTKPEESDGLANEISMSSYIPGLMLPTQLDMLFPTSLFSDNVNDRMTRAIGTGMSVGYVRVNNHFQVWVDEPEGGEVTVSITGPRPHCVLETSVTYTGDHIYEITYRVSVSGHYVITVKWRDQHIQDSPFLCSIEDL